jgi:ubiquinone/menaquinone biosynthesis C-methylase UbiE
MTGNPWSLEACASYVSAQRQNPYESTKHFYRLLLSEQALATTDRLDCLDIGCGSGDVARFLINKVKPLYITGLDNSMSMLSEATNLLSHTQRFDAVYGDIFNIPQSLTSKNWHLIISLATISWLSDPYLALNHISRLNTQWLGFSSLFYSGRISLFTEVREHEDFETDKIRRYYHTLSIPRAEHILKSNGYTSIKWHKFVIDVELPKPVSPDQMKSYTIMLDNQRAIMSGPMLMNWYFCIARK